MRLKIHAKIRLGHFFVFLAFSFVIHGPDTNQVRISKSNTIPQLAEAVITHRNSKEHPQNEVNQKELPQLKKHFTKSKECQGRSHLISC